MTGAAQFKSTLMQQLAAGVDALDIEHAAAIETDPGALAKKMLSVVPRAYVYDAVIGSFYTTEGVRTLLGGASRQAVLDRVKRGTLLKVRSSDGVALYPAFQFDGAQVSARVRDVLALLRTITVDSWTIASWFGVPAEALGGLTPHSWLADPARDLDPVLRLAATTAARWSMP